MSDQIYSWKRFWCPRSGRINLADGGYLCDPEAEWGNVYNPDLVTFEAISKLPCLVLLGEPGMGKTQNMTAEQAIITTKIQEQGGQVLLRDLRSYSSPEWLARKLFDSAEFTNWLRGTHQLHIFLDSLDECLLRIETLATLLVDEFKEYRDQIQRLHLRIACRTAIWPPVLEDGLKQLWGKDAVEVYELAPLRRKDVTQAARAEEIDLDDFLEEIQQKNLVSLAIKPVTLKFLLNTYRRHNSQFPANQRLHELYLEGCRCLCEESNESRLASRLKGKLNLEQRLIVAARIAAITIFANQFAVWTGREQDDVPDEDVLLRKICQGSESVSGREFEVTETAVEEVLDTGLFSSRGLNRMGWAHQTYAEFLAAWYLVQYEILQTVSNKQMQMMKTVLLLAANPKNSSQLRLSEEVREIDEGLTKRSRYRDQFKLESKFAVRQRDFYRHMLDIQPQIVHFSGHGAGEDGIVLEDETGNATFVQADMLASMFKLFASKGVGCVLFNACYSEVQAEAVSKYIPYVIGMNKPIGDKAAIDFAVAFYDALGAGETIEFAFELGCSQLVGLQEHETPVFFVKGVRV